MVLCLFQTLVDTDRLCAYHGGDSMPQHAWGTCNQLAVESSGEHETQHLRVSNNRPDSLKCIMKAGSVKKFSHPLFSRSRPSRMFCRCPWHF